MKHHQSLNHSFNIGETNIVGLRDQYLGPNSFNLSGFLMNLQEVHCLNFQCHRYTNIDR